MIIRDQALTLINEHVNNKNIVKHMVALEAVMQALARKLNGDEVLWGMAGLLHDGDYCDEVSHDKQGIQITQWARDKGYEIPDEVAHAMAAHNWHNTGVAPESLMDWSIFCADSLTGLIVASALVQPDKKLSSVGVTSVLKKFKNKAFAKNCRREIIMECEKLGLSLEEFVTIALTSMQSISSQIGL